MLDLLTKGREDFIKGFVLRVLTKKPVAEGEDDIIEHEVALGARRVPVEIISMRDALKIADSHKSKEGTVLS